jgi:hypothetical protein
MGGKKFLDINRALYIKVLGIQWPEIKVGEKNVSKI